MLQQPKTYGVYFCLGQLHIFEGDDFRPGFVKVGTITMELGDYYSPKTIMEQFNHDNLVRLASLRTHIDSEIKNLRGFKREIDKSADSITYGREIHLTGQSLRKAERFANRLKEMDAQSADAEDG